MLKKAITVVGLLTLGLATTSVVAGNSKSNVACPVDTPYEDSSGNPISFEEKFGDDVLDNLRCNERRSNARLVMQVNLYEQSEKPYGFRNLRNIINDFEYTHGIDNWKIAVVVHSGGWPFVVKDNKYHSMVEGFIANPNVDV